MAKKEYESIAQVDYTAASTKKTIDFGGSGGVGTPPVAPEAVAAELNKQAAIPDTSDMKRVPAPSVQYLDQKDHRKEQLTVLDKANPDFVHSYERRDVTDWELSANDKEIVKDDQGRILHHLGDPVVRRPRTTVEAERLADAERAQEAIETRLDKMSATQFRSPKKPTATVPKGTVSPQND